MNIRRVNAKKEFGLLFKLLIILMMSWVLIVFVFFPGDPQEFEKDLNSMECQEIYKNMMNGHLYEKYQNRLVDIYFMHECVGVEIKYDD